MRCWMVVFLSVVVLACVQPAAAGSGGGGEDMVRAMTKELALSAEQAASVRPIVARYLTARRKYMESLEGAPIINRKEMAETMKKLKQAQRAELSKVLSKEQMAKWTNRENLRARMNAGVSGFQTDEGASISTQGANFNF